MKSNAAGVFVSDISESVESDRVRRVILNAQANYEAYQLLKWLFRGAANKNPNASISGDGFIQMTACGFSRAVNSSLFKIKYYYPSVFGLHYKHDESGIIIDDLYYDRKVMIGANTSKWQSN